MGFQMKIPEKVKDLNRTQVLLLILALTILITNGFRNNEKCDMEKIEEEGAYNETHDLLVDVYVLNQPSYADEDVESLFNELNPMWGQYGIKFHVNNIIRVNKGDFKPIWSSLKVCFSNRSSLEALEFAKSIVGSKLYEDKIIDVILTDSSIKCRIGFRSFGLDLPIMDGQAFRQNDTNFIIFSTKSKNTSWTLAHEFGHALNLRDRPVDGGKCNLMMGKDFQDKQYSTFLDQPQVGRVVSQAKDLEHYK